MSQKKSNHWGIEDKIQHLQILLHETNIANSLTNQPNILENISHNKQNSNYTKHILEYEHEYGIMHRVLQVQSSLEKSITINLQNSSNFNYVKTL
jgi:hypothetical protein